MKKIWTLIIKTSLPNTAEDVTELVTTVDAFSDFETAKISLREKLKDFAFNKNSMFDGQGGIIELEDYCWKLDNEYDDYFKKYGSIIKRGGKKKIELVNQKGEVIEIFKSLDKCAEHLKRDKKEISKMLKCGITKVGRYEIRYSLRNI
jgi:hypothetical protein